jgi:predicted MFS family arabinose efflux permease
LKRYLAVLITGFVVLAVSGSSRFAIGLTLKPMAADFDWSRSTLSLAVLVFFVVTSLCVYLSGRLADRFNLTYILAAGLLISACGIGLIGEVIAPWQAFVLYGLVFAFGNGLTSITPVGVLISRWFPGRIGLANATAISGMGFGQLIMIAILAVVMAQSGWRPVYFWLGMANLILVPFVLIALRKGLANRQKDQVAEEPSATSMDFKDARRTPYFRRLTILFMICGFQDFFVSTHVVAFAQDQGVETLLAGNMLAVMGLTGLIGVLLSGAWSDKTNPLRPTISCFVLRIFLFALILIDQSPISIAVFALGYGVTFWATAPLAVVFARKAFGLKHIGSVTGFVTMAHSLAGGLGAYAGGLLFDLNGNYSAAFAVMLIFSFAGIIYSRRLK